jgi:hypothetical protein
VLGVMCTSHSWVSLRLDGSCSVKQRQALVDTFNDPTVRGWLVVPLPCASTQMPCDAHNLQAANMHKNTVLTVTGLIMHAVLSALSNLTRVACRLSVFAAPQLRAAAVLQGWRCGTQHHRRKPPGAVRPR